MGLHPRNSRGFSLMELLVVLAIVGILAVVGISMVGNREASSVRALMDEVEGSIANARQSAVATGRDVAIVDYGNWTPAAGGVPMVIAYGDARMANIDIEGTANKLLTSLVPDASVAYSQTVAVPFHLLVNNATLVPTDVTQARARIVLAGSGDWAAAAAGATQMDITSVVPFSTGIMHGLVNDTYNFFNGNLQRVVEISGSSQRFASTFIIEIVGTSPNFGPLKGSPMGLIVGLQNGTSIYKFYNPGVLEGNGQWRRI